MSTKPGETLEDFLEWNYSLIIDGDSACISREEAKRLGVEASLNRISLSQFKLIVEHFSGHREAVEDWLDRFESDTMSWRDYAYYAPIPQEVFDKGLIIVNEALTVAERISLDIDWVFNNLDGVEYPVRDKQYVFDFAKENNIVILFGASDDLVEIRGAFYDEIGADDGTIFKLYSKGALPDFDDIDRGDKDALRDYFLNEGKGKEFKALWCPKDESGKTIASWVIQADISHRTFRVMEDEDLYCLGIIFSLSEL